MTDNSEDHKRWREVTFLVPHLWGEILPDFLEEQGFGGQWLDHEDTPPHRLLLRAYIAEEAWRPDLKGQLDAYLEELARVFPPGVQQCQIKTRVIDEENWAADWLPFFEPLKIGSVWIRPSPKAVDLAPGEQEIVLDPGQAFGTGHHETTQLCLEALLDVRSLLKDNAAVLDLGTGSGILAMFAGRLDFKNIMAIDTDPKAVEVALQNVAHNGLKQVIHLSNQPLEAMERGFALILANLTASLHRALAGAMVDRLESGGWLVLGGILNEEREATKGLFLSKGLELIRETTKNDWACLVFQNECLD